mgnify:FL=1
MTRATLLALASRVEAATGADRELDAAIAVAVSDDVGAWVVEPSPSSLFSHQPGWFCTSDNRSHKAPAYTASLDAAMSLVPSGWNHGYSSRQGTEPSWRVVAQCWNAKPASTLHGEAATPALALTAACLRARAIAWSMTDD